MELPDEMRLFARGWLHGNAVIVRDPEPVVIDTGYHTGTEELLDALRCFCGGTAVDRVLLTHVHADHAGGVATLVDEGAPLVFAHRDARDIVNAWDATALWLHGTGQVMPRFTVDVALDHGQSIRFAHRDWQVIHTPGHATGGVSYLSGDGVLITGDALWEDGFGILNPWVDGPEVVDQAARALDRLARTDARVIIPGHGPVFSGLDAAIDRARSRLAYLREHPERMLRQNLKNCVGFLRLLHPDMGAVEVRAVIESLAQGAAAPPDMVDAVLAGAGLRPG